MQDSNNMYKYSYEGNNKYCYPNTDVLINKFGIKDSIKYYSLERSLSSARQASINIHPLPGKLDFNHLKAIHEYLFQDIFSWAGETRTVNIAKTDLFCLVQHIDSFGNDIFEKLKLNNYLKNLKRDEFVIQLVNLLGDINALHPFREGNGRTQREFIRYVAAINGYGLDWSKVNMQENIIASHESLNGDNKKLEMIISRILYSLEDDDKKLFEELLKEISK